MYAKIKEQKILNIRLRRCPMKKLNYVNPELELTELSTDVILSSIGGDNDNVIGDTEPF